MTVADKVAREAVSKLKQAVELCTKLNQENRELHQILDDTFHHMDRIRELERELLLRPTSN